MYEERSCIIISDFHQLASNICIIEDDNNTTS